MQKKWLIKQNDLTPLNDFSAPDFIKNILINRDVKTKSEAEKFLNPNYSKLLSPFEMLNMRKAAERIIKAIKENQKIIIYGDYDADGICAAAVFHSFFKAINYSNFEVYIPNRYEDGYGINLKSIDEFIAKKISLIITVDCGISNIYETKYAANAGIHTIITDHHLPQDSLPAAEAIIDVHQTNDTYEFKDLCGTAVAFKTISAILELDSFGLKKGWEKWLLDLTAIATIADMSRLTDENRILVHYGIIVLKKTKRLGILALLKKANINKYGLTSEDIAFFMAPRVNAASRIGHANTSFELITAESLETAAAMASHLEEKNNERKKMVESVINEAREKIDPEKEIIILGNTKWSAGILGASASRLMEECGKPVFLWGKGEAKEIKGSCRSNGPNLVELMKTIKQDIFLDLGGHKFAAGFSLKEGTEKIFEKEILKLWKKLPKKIEENILEIDSELALSDLIPENYNWLSKIEPTGQGNSKPVFLFKNLKIENIKSFGNGGIHLELTFKKPSGDPVRAIGFFMSNSYRLSNSLCALKKDDTIDLAASFDKNYFNGKIEFRLKIIDIKPC